MILAWKFPVGSGNDSRYVMLAKLDSTRNSVVTGLLSWNGLSRQIGDAQSSATRDRDGCFFVTDPAREQSEVRQSQARQEFENEWHVDLGPNVWIERRDLRNERSRKHDETTSSNRRPPEEDLVRRRGQQNPQYQVCVLWPLPQRQSHHAAHGPRICQRMPYLLLLQ